MLTLVVGFLSDYRLCLFPTHSRLRQADSPLPIEKPCVQHSSTSTTPVVVHPPANNLESYNCGRFDGFLFPLYPSTPASTCTRPWVPSSVSSITHEQWVDAVIGTASRGFCPILDLSAMQAVQHEGPSALADHPVLADVSRDLSLKGPVPKNVAFELLLDDNSKVRARIPMRVQIYPHDTTDSIVTTVKNFYGIYDGTASGVSFEDEHGTTLIARYENLKNNMTVYVRVIPIQPFGDSFYGGFPAERKRPSLGEPFQMVDGMAPVMDQPSRPSSRLARKRSTSPSNRSLRSASQHKQTSRNGIKSRGSSIHGGYPDEDPGLSDTESTYTRKSRGDTFASSEISMENILQDGRRKRPKFDSSVSDLVRSFFFIFLPHLISFAL